MMRPFCLIRRQDEKHVSVHISISPSTLYETPLSDRSRRSEEE